MVLSVALYVVESWTFMKSDGKTIETFETGR